jgi:hypothetical protein
VVSRPPDQTQILNRRSCRRRWLMVNVCLASFYAFFIVCFAHAYISWEAILVAFRALLSPVIADRLHCVRVFYMSPLLIFLHAIMTFVEPRSVSRQFFCSSFHNTSFLMTLIPDFQRYIQLHQQYQDHFSLHAHQLRSHHNQNYLRHLPPERCERGRGSTLLLHQPKLPDRQK